jgi:hypothetical protein
MTVLVHLSNDGWPVGSGPVRSRVVRSWSRDNNWSWGVWLDWSGAIGGSWGIDGLTRVLNISDVTSVGIRGVGDSLKATIGKSNVVFSLGGITVAGLRSSKVGTTVAVIDSIGVVICWGDIGVNWSRSIGWDWDRGRSISGGRGGDGVLRSSSGNSHKSKQSNKALKEKILFVEFQFS